MYVASDLRSDFPSPPGGRGGAWNDVKGLTIDGRSDAVEESEMRGGWGGGGSIRCEGFGQGFGGLGLIRPDLGSGDPKLSKWAGGDAERMHPDECIQT